MNMTHNPSLLFLICPPLSPLLSVRATGALTTIHFRSVRSCERARECISTRTRARERKDFESEDV